MTLRRRSLLVAAVAAPALVGIGLGLRSARAQTALPTPSLVAGLDGEVRTFELDWADAARQRPVPVRLYLPATASAARCGATGGGLRSRSRAAWRKASSIGGQSLTAASTSAKTLSSALTSSPRALAEVRSISTKIIDSRVAPAGT
jgi:hypothetical protein